MKLMHWRLWSAALFVLVLPCAVAADTVFVEGQAVYRERIMPPPGAMLIVTLEDVSRADAPAIEIAKVQRLVTSGPPFGWRLGYDPTLAGAPNRMNLRASIVSPAGLWMTTDTAMPLPNAASGGEPSLKLVRVTPVPANPAAPSASQPGSTRNADCAAPITQADMARCAHEDFLVAGDAYSKQYAALSATLTAAQRDRLRKMQKAWLGYRTAACAFESGAAQGGSVQSQINGLCAARMTRERAGELARMASCREGDVTCNRGGR